MESNEGMLLTGVAQGNLGNVVFYQHLHQAENSLKTTWATKI